MARAAGGNLDRTVMTDSDVSRNLSHVPNTLSHYNTLSNAGIGALVGSAAGMWLLSYPSHNEHWRETGLLAGEAALNSLIPVEVFKYGLGRDRPLQGMGGGGFFQEAPHFRRNTAPRLGRWPAWLHTSIPVPCLSFCLRLASLVSYSGFGESSTFRRTFYRRHHRQPGGAPDLHSPSRSGTGRQ